LIIKTQSESRDVGFVVLNATFNYISALSWRSVSLAEEAGRNHEPVANYW